MNILLTGATSGIGLETLKSLLDDKNKVFAVARDFSKISNLLELHSDSLVPITFDLKETENIEKIFNEINLVDEKLDALIHCAGIEETIPLTLYSPAKIKNIYEVNVFAGIELLRHFTKKKYSNDGATAVFVSSVMGVLGQPGKIGYCSSKAAVLGMVKASALEFAKRKIRVNAVLPGVVNTPMTQNLFSQISAENVEEIKAMHPLGIGEVSDVVPTIEFLISASSRWITGQNFIIDGGYSIQ
ncbi:SDR family NAD(P)-dependent oxidoreductase [Flavobacterium ammonificans]|uniref:SDR family NAD(P)-dependent oxidoreductase n=1 Tax=Flavobacterium ammonificans TaxID=1751056 RepID=UPI001E29A511|nr:SDR family oxidoreductase [Flavobacterium ammonificans]BDB56776.1 oxidoreductase [Flavobacterium ammonificans]